MTTATQEKSLSTYATELDQALANLKDRSSDYEAKQRESEAARVELQRATQRVDSIKNEMRTLLDNMGTAPNAPNVRISG